MNDEKYPNLGSTRWIVEIEPECGRVVLDDGSQWQIDDDQHLADRWIKTTTVTVEPMIENRDAEFVLQSVDMGGVPAVLLGFGPLGRQR